MSSTNAAMIAAKILTHALRNPTPAPPFATIGNTQLLALKQLTEIFQSITAQPKLTIPTTPPTPGATFVLPSPVTTPPRVQNTSPNEHANNQPCMVPNDYPMTHTCQHLQQPTTTPHSHYSTWCWKLQGCTHTGTHTITTHAPPSCNPATMPLVSPNFNVPQPGQLRHWHNHQAKLCIPPSNYQHCRRTHKIYLVKIFCQKWYLNITGREFEGAYNIKISIMYVVGSF